MKGHSSLSPDQPVLLPQRITSLRDLQAAREDSLDSWPAANRSLAVDASQTGSAAERLEEGSSSHGDNMESSSSPAPLSSLSRLINDATLIHNKVAD
ncbi:unnamed protein product [Arctogadus glacialis]